MSYSTARCIKPMTAIIIMALFSLMMGVMLLTEALAQTSADTYPPSPKVDGIDLRSTQTPPIVARSAPPNRFLPILSNNAVLDRQTGVVWERSPDTLKRNWPSAVSHCATKGVGGRKGWRVASGAELKSLIDPTNPGGNPDFPVGHPFNTNSFQPGSRNAPGFYWLADTKNNGPGGAWDVFVNDGIQDKISEKNEFLVWCVIGDPVAETRE